MPGSLTTPQLSAVRKRIMDALCGARVEIPLSHKNKVDAMLIVMDDALSAAETSVIQGVETETKTWLMAHPKIARQIMAEIELARKVAL